MGLVEGRGWRREEEKSESNTDAGGGVGGHKVQAVRRVGYGAVPVLVGQHRRYAQAEGCLRLAQRLVIDLVICALHLFVILCSLTIGFLLIIFDYTCFFLINSGKVVN